MNTMKHVDKNPTQAGKSIEISAHDFPVHSRNQFWYIGIALLLAGFIYLSIFSQDYMSAAVTLAVGIAIFRLANLKPEHRKIIIADNGLYWGDTFFGYHQLRAFWLDMVEGNAVVYVQRLNFNSPISFTATNSQAEEIIGKLLKHLPLHEHKSEPFTDRFSRFFKL